MEAPFYIAKIIGPILFVMGIFSFTHQKLIHEVIKSLENNPALLTFGGVFNLLMGMTITTFYNLWGFDWTILVTLLGWTFVLRGLLITFFRKDFIHFINLRATKLQIWGAIPLAWGALLSYFGYFF